MSDWTSRNMATTYNMCREKYSEFRRPKDNATSTFLTYIAKIEDDDESLRIEIVLHDGSSIT